MKILCVSYEYPPLGGGGAPVCEQLCRAFVSLGHQVDALTSGMRGLPAEETRNGVRIHRAACLRRYQHFSTASELATTLLPAYWKGRELVDRNRYDIIHCHFIVPSGIVAAALSNRSGIPYVLTAHGSDIPGYNPDRFKMLHRVIRPLWLKIVSDADSITTPSKFLSKLLKTSAGATATLIPNTFELPPPSNQPKRNRILAVSRLFERKGMQYLIEAFHRLNSDWELVIAGDGPYLSKLHEQSDRLSARVTFPGFIKGRPLNDLYASAKIFVLPSIRENFPVVLLEAMAAGCAVITTRGSGCEEVVGAAGILVDSANAPMLAAAIQDLIDDEELLEQHRRLSIERVRGFEERAIAERFDQLFRACLDDRNVTESEKR